MNRPTGKHNLVDWIKPYLSDKRKLKSIIDSRLEGKYPSKAAVHMASLSLKCIESEQKHRPSMKDVVETLEWIETAAEKLRVPRRHSTNRVAQRHGQQPLHHRSLLHQRQDGGQAYQSSSRVNTRK